MKSRETTNYIHLLGIKATAIFLQSSLPISCYPLSSWAQPNKTFSLAFVKQTYLLDVALDELWGGHLLSRQALFQLEFARWADWLAPFHPACNTVGVTMNFSLSVNRPVEQMLRIHKTTNANPHSQPA